MALIKYHSTRECRKDVELMKSVNQMTLYEKFPDAEVQRRKTKGFRTREELSSFLYHTYEFETIELAIKAKNAHYHKVKRVQKRVAYILLAKPESYFVTLTFRDDVLETTTEETRREYVRKFLKEKAKANGSHYVANVDYGRKNEREHYHAVANVSGAGWPHGYQKSERVELFAPLSAKYDNLPDEEYKAKALDVTMKRLSKYTAKLGFHALKDSTKDASLIYSRMPTEKPKEEPEKEKPKPCLEVITDEALILAIDLAFCDQLSIDDV